MAPFLTLLPLLAACVGKEMDDTAEPCVSEDPCECGVAWTERNGPSPTVRAAINDARSGDTVHICAGEIRGTVGVTPAALYHDDNPTELTLVGAGVGATILTPVEDPEHVTNVLSLEGLGVDVSDLTIYLGAGYGHSGDTMSDPVRFAGGLYACDGTFVLENVMLDSNVANFGAGFSTCYGDIGPTDLTFVDSAVVNNRANGWDEEVNTGGGGWLSGDYRVESIRTDWGTGKLDNTPDDIAIGPFGGPFTSYADFGDDEDFVCTSETDTCERTAR